MVDVLVKHLCVNLVNKSKDDMNRVGADKI